MLNGEILTQIKGLADQASQKADEYSGVISSVQQLIVKHFGQNGLYAAYIVLAVLILFIVSRLGKLAFSTVKYLVIPSVALAFIGSLFVNQSFVVLLPVTVTLCSLFLLFRG
ncbi:MAG: hypothetical protein GXO93_08110 [FCB group bacterium]|nr:hypothetical protein [FCB group bacterium]